MRLNLDRLRESFGPRVGFRKVRPEIHEVSFPMYAEDGDPLAIYLREDGDSLVLTDLGLTLMRLSYELDVTTEAQTRTFQEIVRQNGLEEEDGEVMLRLEGPDLYPSLLQFAQTLGKLGSMPYFRRAVNSSRFYEIVRTVVNRDLAEFIPVENYAPIPGRPEFTADFALTRLATPAYLYAVRTSEKAREATICLLSFLNANIPFQGIVIYESYADLPKKDFRWLSSAADKQFVDLTDFKENGRRYFERFRHAG